MTTFSRERGAPNKPLRQFQMMQTPSEAFIKLTRNPKVEAPARFKATEKAPGDIVISSIGARPNA